MVILAQSWAENYMKEHPGRTIQVTGGGSGVGIAALINGGTDICEASRPMKDVEKEQALKRHGKEVKEIPVALDGVAIYVSESNPIQSLTQPQLKAIYTGKDHQLARGRRQGCAESSPTAVKTVPAPICSSRSMF